MRIRSEDLTNLCNHLSAELFLLQYTHTLEKKLLAPKLDAVVMKLGGVLMARPWDDEGYAEVELPSEDQTVIVIALDAYLLNVSCFHGQLDLVRTVDRVRELMGLFR